MEKILENSTSTIALVIGVVIVVSILAYLISKGKLNVKSDKFSIESAKQNTKSLMAECRYSCSLLAVDFASKYIDKYPNCRYQILYICELVLNRIEQMLEFNNITTNSDYIEMRYTDIKAIIDSHMVSGGNYDEAFYRNLHDSFEEIVKQIVILKRHYHDES